MRTTAAKATAIPRTAASWISNRHDAAATATRKTAVASTSTGPPFVLQPVHLLLPADPGFREAEVDIVPAHGGAVIEQDVLEPDVVGQPGSVVFVEIPLEFAPRRGTRAGEASCGRDTDATPTMKPTVRRRNQTVDRLVDQVADEDHRRADEEATREDTNHKGIGDETAGEPEAFSLEQADGDPDRGQPILAEEGTPHPVEAPRDIRARR